ncbi:MAG: carbamate kinase [bacterium]
MSKTALIAIGGNSLIRAGERGAIDEQLANAQATAKALVQMVKDGWHIVVTHGNGPQVGAALLRSERAAGEVYTHPLDVCVATTQTEIGYLLERGLYYELRIAGLTTPVITILTQVRVDQNDPAFLNPEKPIGPFYSEKIAEEKHAQFGWQLKEDASRGYRRVVPSPEPLDIIEGDTIHTLLDQGFIVIALGGGGIPVEVREDHSIIGVEAVIDKDRASALLASRLGVDTFIISTDADQVYLDYKKPTQRGLSTVTVDELQRHYDAGQFPPGSMGPKIQSALRFLRNGGSNVIITTFTLLPEALKGNAGTHIVR